MAALFTLMKRNIKLYFKDKAMFFTSLITPVILLVLYTTFLKNVFEESFRHSFVEMGATISEKTIQGLVAGQLCSSLLAVCCVTVAFCSNMLMVQDKATGISKDFAITPMKRSTLALSYYIANLVSTLIICYSALALCFVYIAIVGWYLTIGDVFLIILNVFLLSLFGCALSSVIHFFLSSQGQLSAVGTIISAGYGFICGAYMPISSFSTGLQNVMSFLPGTYGTSLMRSCFLQTALDNMSAENVPIEAIEELKNSVDCHIYFFGHSVSTGVKYIVLCGTIVILIGTYILLHVVMKKKQKRG